MPLRFDSAPLGQVTRTPQGFLRAPARVTRTGVLTYRRADGTVVRELRRPEHVFAAKSLDTLRDAPVTDLHPREMVTASNAQQLSLGHVSGDARADGTYVSAELLITDAKLIAAVQERKRAEVSCGYSCELLEKPGVYNGERYDAEQTNIIYNHVGLGPHGWGRAGSAVAVRLDSQADDFELPDDAAQRVFYKDAADGGPTKDRPMDLVSIRLDGIEAQVTPTAQQLITRTIETRDATLAQLRADAEAQKKRLDAVEGELASTKTQLAAATDVKRFDGAVRERLALLDRVRPIIADTAALASKSTREIQLAALAALRVDGDFAQASDEYVAAYFDAELRRGGTQSEPHKPPPRNAPPTHHVDQSDDVDGILAGRYQQRNGEPPKLPPEPWRQPLASNRPA